MLKRTLAVAVPKVTVTRAQEGVCTESQLRAREDQGTLRSFFLHTVWADRHPVPISKTQSSNSNKWGLDGWETGKRLPTGDRDWGGGWGTNAVVATHSEQLTTSMVDNTEEQATAAQKAPTLFM